MIGYQALLQQSEKKQHKLLPNIRFSSPVTHITDSLTKVQTEAGEPSRTAKSVITLDPTLPDKVAAAQAKWIFKVVESDMSLRMGDHIGDLFETMFPDREISKQFFAVRKGTIKDFLYHSGWNRSSSRTGCL